MKLEWQKGLSRQQNNNISCVVLAVCYFQAIIVTYFLKGVNCQCFHTYYAFFPCLQLQGINCFMFLGMAGKMLLTKRVVRAYVASAGVCLLLQLWSLPANLWDNIAKMLYFSGYHSFLLFRFQFKTNSCDGLLHWYSSVPVGTCRGNCLTDGCVQFNR